jgi:glycerol-3-phosphate acyltransferase PlsY
MTILAVLVAAYLIGSVPNGYFVIKRLTGQDLTKIGSGRTGATNAMRAGGLWAGFLTAALDVLKGAVAIVLTRIIISGSLDFLQVSAFPWVEAAAAVAAVVGHNWSIYIGWHGGAGTGPNVGAAIALWPFSALILLPFVPIVVFGTGYASVASLATALLIPILFALTAYFGVTPWIFVLYGIATLLVVTWSLRPNIKRLLAGEERMVGPRSKKQAGPTHS